MTIAVVRPDGSWHVRPDSTHKRFLDEFYLPDGFESATVYNGLFIRTLKTGKAIGEKFVPRYYDSFGRCKLIYCHPGDVTVVDCSTIITAEDIPASELTESEKQHISQALCKVSRLMTMKKGDMLILEQDPSCEGITIK